MIVGTLPGFPRLLARAWRATDPASRCDRPCDALGRPTPHQRLRTVRGDYWICAETGQMARDIVIGGLPARYDGLWEEKHLHGAAEGKPRPEHAPWLARVAPFRRTGKLLEVGCGLGLFLKAAREAGWQAEANELSPFAARRARETAGARVIVGALEEVALDSAAYDVILCNNVFEHLRQPRLVLGKLAAALRPGGALFLQTLSAQSLSLCFQPTAWSYYGEGHLFVPTLVSLARYFEACGLRPLRVETHGFHSGPSRPSEGPLPRRLFDKIVAALAARLRCGHRVKVLLQRPD